MPIIWDDQQGGVATAPQPRGRIVWDDEPTDGSVALDMESPSPAERASGIGPAIFDSKVSGFSGGTPDDWTQQYAGNSTYQPTISPNLVPHTISGPLTRETVAKQRYYEDDQGVLQNGQPPDKQPLPTDPEQRQFEMQRQRDRVAQDRWWNEAEGVRNAKRAELEQQIQALGPILEPNQLPQGDNFSAQAARERNEYAKQQRYELLRQIEQLNTYMPSEAELRPAGEASERGAIRQAWGPRTLESTAKGLRNNIQQIAGVAASEVAGVLGDEETQKQMMGFAKRRGQEQQHEQAVQAELDKRSLIGERPAAWTRQAAETLAPALVFGGPGLAAYFGSQAYAEAMADGRTRKEAIQNAATEAVMTLAGARLGAGTATLAGKISGRSASRIAGQTLFKQAMAGVKGAAVEIPEEVTTEWLHYMHAVANGRTDYNPNDLRKILTDTAVIAGLAGGTPGAVETLVNSGTKLYGVAADYKRAKGTIAAKLAAEQPISRGDLEKIGVSSNGTSARTRVEIARKELLADEQQAEQVVAPVAAEAGAGPAGPVAEEAAVAGPAEGIPAPAPEQVAPPERIVGEMIRDAGRELPDLSKLTSVIGDKVSRQQAETILLSAGVDELNAADSALSLSEQFGDAIDVGLIVINANSLLYDADRRGRLAEALTEAGDARTLEYTKGDRRILVHPSTRNPGKWQVTTADKHGPSGHTDHNSRDEAIAVAIGAHPTNSVNDVGDSEYKLTNVGHSQPQLTQEPTNETVQQAPQAEAEAQGQQVQAEGQVVPPKKGFKKKQPTVPPAPQGGTGLVGGEALSPQQVTDAYLRSELERVPDGGTIARNYANTFVRPLVSRMEKAGDWKTSAELTVKGRSKKPHNPADDLAKLVNYGLVQRAWDNTGNPHYALQGTQLPSWLTTSNDDSAMEALPSRTGETTTGPFELSREGSPDKSPIVEPYRVPDEQRLPPPPPAERQPQLLGLPEDLDPNVAEGQQGLFDRPESAVAEEPAPVTISKRELTALNKKVDELRESSIDPDSLDDVDTLLTHNPTYLNEAFKEAQTLANKHNAEANAARAEWSTVFGAQSAAKRKKSLSKKGQSGDAAGTFKAFDVILQNLRDNPGLAPNIRATAERMGDGDLESGLYAVLQAGQRQFKNKTAADFLAPIVRQASNDLTAFDFGNYEGDGKFAVESRPETSKAKAKVTTQRIKRQFPGAKVRQTSDNQWQVRLPNKNVFAVAAFESVRPTPEYAAEVRSRYPGLTDEEWADVQAAGVWFAVSKDGKVVNVIGISDAAESGARTLSHEAVHAARTLGLWSDEEWAALSKKYGEGLTDEKAIEEAIASAAEAKAPGLRAKVKEFLKKILRAMGFRKFSPDAIDLMHTEDFWKRGGKFGDAKAMFQSAYHGSPHRFDKFTTEKMGSGEGSQAFGWGMYFAGNQEVAKFYKDKLSKGGINNKKLQSRNAQLVSNYRNFKLQHPKLASQFESDIAAIGGGPYTTTDFATEAANVISRHRTGGQQIVSDEVASEMIGKITDDNPVNVVDEERTGALYKVDLKPAENEYLLWDVPLSEQSEKVQKAMRSIVPGDLPPAIRTRLMSAANPETKKSLESLRDGVNEIESQMHRMADSEPFNRADYDILSDKRYNLVQQADEMGGVLVKGVDKWTLTFKDDTGQQAYRMIAATRGLGTNEYAADRGASEYLKSLGIRGIKFLDQGSRGKGEGTYNYVIFDDADVEIEDVQFQLQVAKRQTETPAFKELASILGSDSAARAMVSTSNKPYVDGLKAHAEAIADFLESSTSTSHADGGGNVPSAVVSHVFSMAENDEILNAIVKAIPVDVVNLLARKKISPKHLLRDKAMLKDVLVVDKESAIALGVDVSITRTLLRSIADNATKIADLASGTLKGSLAGSTGADDSVSLAHTRSILDNPNFSKWFGNSKVVDAEGNPLVVYHGTGAKDDFSVFESRRPQDVIRIDGKEVPIANSWDMGSDYKGMPEGIHYGAKTDAIQMGAEKAYQFRLKEASRFVKDDGTYSPDTTRHLNDLKRLIGKKFEQTTENRPTGGGFYFTPSHGYSFIRDIGGLEQGRVKPVYLSIQNPKWMNASEIESAGYDFRVEELKKQGYDGAIFANDQKDITKDGWSGSTQIVAFSPTQIKSAIGNKGTFDPSNPDVRFQLQPKNKPRWYSTAAKVINSKMGPKGTSNQVLAMLEKNGVKPEELEWMGLKELLAKAPRTVTKQEVLNAIENGVQIEEVVKGEHPKSGSWLRRLNPLGATATIRDADGNVVANNLTQDEAELAVKSEPKFSKWTEPGGENYRELLLTLPNAGSELQKFQNKMAAKYGEQYKYDVQRFTPDEQRQYKNAANRSSGRDESFRSSHFDEPNILAHIRFNERTDSDGNKVLFIEEVQSDWAQEGREEGYRGQIPPNTNIKPIAEGESGYDNGWRYVVVDKDGVPLRDGYGATEEDAAKNARPGPKSVPDRPYKKTAAWSMLAMKRAIQFAAENGFDKIAWTTGQQQADRYDLSKHVERIAWFPGSGRVDITPIGRDTQEGYASADSIDALAKRIGKEAAEKINQQMIKNPNQMGYYLEGLDLKVGGEGLKAFYDEILPSETNKFIKKFGAKVGKMEVPTAPGERQYKVMTELEYWETGGGRRVGMHRPRNENAPIAVVQLGESINKTGPDSFASTEDAEKWVRDKNREAGKYITNPGFDITDAMRKSALGEGMPMFQLTSPDPKVRRKLANIGTTEDVRTWLADLDRAATEAGEPGTRSDDEVDAEATALLASDRAGVRAKVLAAASRDGQLNDAETVAAKRLFQQEAFDALVSGDQQKIMEASKLRDAYRATGTSQARSFRQRQDPLNGHNIYEATPEERKTAITDDLFKRPSKLEDARRKALKNLDTGELEKIDAEWARRLRKIDAYLHRIGLSIDQLEFIAENPEATIRARAQIGATDATWDDKLYEFYQNSILSGPLTQLVNITGNAGSGIWEFGIQRQVEAMVNAGMWDKSGARPGEVPYIWKGLRRGVTAGLHNAMVTWRTELPVTQETKWDTPRVAIGGKTGRVVRSVGWRPLGMADEFFNSLFSNLQIGAEAYRQARLQGLEGDRLASFIDSEIATKDSLSWRLARAHSAELTFQQGAEGATKAVRDAGLYAKRAPYIGRFLRWVIPFVTFPVNSAATALRKAPVTGDMALAKRIYNNFRDGKRPTFGLSRPVAERVIAWGVTALVASTLDDDDPWITGSATTPHGHPRNSIRINGKWYDYGRVEPFATTLGLLVDGINTLKHGDAWDAAKAPFDLTVSQITNKTFLKGLGDILEATGAGKPYRTSASEGLGAWAARFSEGFVPNFYRQTVEATRGSRTEYRVWGNSKQKAKRTLERLAEGVEIPGVKHELAYDPWGRKIDKSTAPFWSAPSTDFLYRILSPMQSTAKQPTVGDRIIAKWNNSGQDDNPVILRAPDPTFTRNGGKYYMTGEQYETFQRDAGELADTLVREWDRRFNVLDSTTPPTKDQLNELKRLVSEARKAVRDEMVAKLNSDQRKHNQSLRAKLEAPEPTQRTGEPRSKYEARVWRHRARRIAAKRMLAT